MRKVWVFVFLALVATGMVAQDSPVVNCGMLTDEDCAILQESAAAMASVGAASFDFALDVSLTGIPGGSGDTVFAMDGSGSYAFNLELLTALEAIDPNDTAAVIDALGDALRGFSGEINMTLTLGELLAAGGSDVPSAVILELVMVDGIGYLNFDPLQDVMQGSGLEVEGWAGLDLNDSLDQMGLLLAGMGGMAMPEAPQPMELEEQNKLLEEATRIERLADADGAAVFESTFDFSVLLADPVYRELLLQQLGLQAAAQGLTPEDYEAILNAMSENPDTVTIRAVQHVDLETYYTTHVEFDMVFDLDVFMEAMEPGSSFGMGDVEMGLFGEMHFADFNDAAQIRAPEGAVIVDFFELLNVLMGGGSGAF